MSAVTLPPNVSVPPGTTTQPPAGPPAAPQRGGFDWWLFLPTCLIAGLGLLMMLSASSLMADQQFGDSLHFVSRQVSALVLGLALATAVLLAPWRLVRRGAWWLYGAVLLGLVLVFTPLGHEVNGSMRWIQLGFVNIQPSEYAKIALILVLAHYLSANEGRLKDTIGVLLPAMALPVPLMGLVILEPDFGSTVLLVAITGLMLFIAGLQWRYVVGLGTTAVVGLGFVLVLEPYRVKRLVSFLDPFADPDGSGYQVVQGWIALASGGLTGQGLATGVAQRGFLPEAHTDFISAVVGEELGAIGFVAMVCLYLIVIWRGLRIAERASDLFGTLVATGITTLLGAQAVINLGVVVGWMPAKGLVLPFMSYGASAITVHTLCMGLLLRIGMESGPRTNP